MKIFFDLDGTILDSKPRLYNLFQYLVPESNFSFEMYWELKQDKVTHREILTKYFGYSEVEVSLFTREWMLLIESPKWLSYDKPFPGVKDLLESLRRRYDLFIVTARQFELITRDQIRDAGLAGLFSDILVTQQKTEKECLIKANFELTKSDWIIGDTGKDIEVGKKLGISTCAVLSGFLSKKQLETYSPDIIVTDITHLKF
jgi:phosphoglycolate phosphatase